MKPWKILWPVLAILVSHPALAQSPANKYLGKDQFTAAQLATTQRLTPPGGTTYANFWPECSVTAASGACIRINPNGAADGAASAGLGSLQLYLGESVALPSTQVILATGATGATGSTYTLTVYYYGN